MSLLNRVQEEGRRVVMVGNVAQIPTLLSSGMLFLKLAWESADEQGNPLPVRFESVKFWGDDAIALTAALNKGDRIKVYAIEKTDTYPDNRSDEEKKQFPRSGFQYIGHDVDILFKKANVEILKPAKKARKSRKQA